MVSLYRGGGTQGKLMHEWCWIDAALRQGNCSFHAYSGCQYAECLFAGVSRQQKVVVATAHLHALFEASQVCTLGMQWLSAGKHKRFPVLQ
eukprot:1157646-Pelagomonas_calceolata.AAC.14